MFDTITYALCSGGGGGLPVVDFGDLEFDTTKLFDCSAEVSAKLSEAFATGMPIVGKFVLNNSIGLTTVGQRLIIGGVEGIIFQLLMPEIGNRFMIFFDEAGAWSYECSDSLTIE